MCGVAPLQSLDQAGVVLVIDASDSMHGASIETAFAAARQFAAQRNPRQPLAVVVFNNRATVLLPFTTNGDKIAAALATSPKLAHGTHILDAAAQGLSLIGAAHMQSGSVVIMSDGADTGSGETLAKLDATARDERARVYTVGLQSSDFQPQLLQQIAGATGGSYTERILGRPADHHLQRAGRGARQSVPARDTDRCSRRPRPSPCG